MLHYVGDWRIDEWRKYNRGIGSGVLCLGAREQDAGSNKWSHAIKIWRWSLLVIPISRALCLVTLAWPPFNMVTLGFFILPVSGQFALAVAKTY